MRLSAADFPADTPLHHFFAWNKRAWLADPRYRALCDPDHAPTAIADAVRAACGSTDIAAHARVFAALELFSVKLKRRAGPSPRPSPRGRGEREGPTAKPWEGEGPARSLALSSTSPKPALEAAERPSGRRRILVIRLSALGDFVQALGPFAALRRHHATDHLALLTTTPLVEFARSLDIFDEVLVDERPRALALAAWWHLRRLLRSGRYDRVYDLQTSQRSGLYAWLMRPGLPEWSGIAWQCSHPHANLDRDRQHTLDKQAEQLMMAGIHPTLLPELPSIKRPLPDGLDGQAFVLIVPGSSPQRPDKRWPAERFAEVAAAIDRLGHVPVVIGSAAETPLAATIRERCPAALDLTGKTDLTTLAAIAQHARLTLGNDTGVCHLAAAANCPVIVLFSRASDPAMCAPRGRLVRVIAEPELADLPSLRVIAEAEAILGPDIGGAGSRLAAPGIT